MYKSRLIEQCKSYGGLSAQSPNGPLRVWLPRFSNSPRIACSMLNLPLLAGSFLMDAACGAVRIDIGANSVDAPVSMELWLVGEENNKTNMFYCAIVRSNELAGMKIIQN